MAMTVFFKSNKMGEGAKVVIPKLKAKGDISAFIFQKKEAETDVKHMPNHPSDSFEHDICALKNNLSCQNISGKGKRINKHRWRFPAAQHDQDGRQKKTYNFPSRSAPEWWQKFLSAL